MGPFPFAGEQWEPVVYGGWEKLCRAVINRVEPCLRGGTHGGRRRALLAALVWRTRRYWTFFYTVQTTQDEIRLRQGGKPWPTAATRAHFGPGVYAWKHLSDARKYRRMLRPQVPDLRILRFLVLRWRLHSFTRIDVDTKPDPDAWMRQYSLLGTDTPLPHGAQYIRRHTGLVRGEDTAVEHFFARSVFSSLVFFRGHVRAD